MLLFKISSTNIYLGQLYKSKAKCKDTCRQASRNIKVLQKISWHYSTGQDIAPRLTCPTYHPLEPRHLAALWRIVVGRWEAGREERKHLREWMRRWWEDIRLRTPRRKYGWAASRSSCTAASHTLLLNLPFIQLLLLHLHLRNLQNIGGGLFFQSLCLPTGRLGICLFQAKQTGQRQPQPFSEP